MDRFVVRSICLAVLRPANVVYLLVALCCAPGHTNKSLQRGNRQLVPESTDGGVMGRVHGKVVLRGTGVGVPGLLVTVSDRDPTPTTPSPGRPAPNDDESRWVRRGSILTTGDGTFAVDEVETSPGDRGPRRDLRVVVSPPDDGASAREEPATRL